MNRILFRHLRNGVCLRVALAAILVLQTYLVAEPIPVIQRQGAVHGLLLLRDEAGKEIAVGDQTVEVHGAEVHTRMTFRFRDGSVDDETTVFRQGRVFRLMYDHLIQKGPSFSKPTDLTIDVAHGNVTWADPSGKEKAKSQKMKLPTDLVNGMMSLIVEDFPSKTAELKVSYLILESKPRVVTFTAKPDGSDKVQVGSSGREADRFNVHIDIGGIAGVVAPLIGKQPPDIKIWALHGPAPVFLRMDAPLYPEGPIWKIFLTAPEWSSEEHPK